MTSSRISIPIVIPSAMPSGKQDASEDVHNALWLQALMLHLKDVLLSQSTFHNRCKNISKLSLIQSNMFALNTSL